MEKIDEIDMRVSKLEGYSKDNNKMTQEIHTALLGTYDKKGLINKVEKMKDIQNECMNRRKTDNKEKRGLYFYIEKTLIASGLGYVIAKIKGIL